MGDFRARMNEARQQLHDNMSQDALYFVGPYDPLTTVVLPVTVRVHEKWLALGDLKGTSFNYAEVESIAPKMIFMNAEVTPDRGAIVSVSPGIAFTIDTPLEPDGISTTCTVIKFRQGDTEGFPVP